MRCVCVLWVAAKLSGWNSFHIHDIVSEWIKNKSRFAGNRRGCRVVFANRWRCNSASGIPLPIHIAWGQICVLTINSTRITLIGAAFI